MRLPADATLIVVGDPAEAGEPDAARAVAALLDAWAREALPVVEARAEAGGLFDDGGLEARLEGLGATTLVVCGGESGAARGAQDAEALGFRVFFVRDACWRDGGPAAGEAGTAVTTAAALAAAALARARQRMRRDR